MQQKLYTRRWRFSPFITLPVILAVCLVLWFIMSNTRYSPVQGTAGVWDLRGFSFDDESARILGDVEYIPNALLTPEEFEARAGEIQLGDPSAAAAYSTSRIRILLPEGATYMIAGRSVDYSDRVYVNGKLMAEVGTPGPTKEASVPNTADLALVDEPVDGVITIVRQSSNFVHRSGSNHADWRVGLPGVVRASYRSDITAMVMGCFLALFLVHLALFTILPGYRANLYFSLYCLVWFFRTGVTGVKLFSSLLPWLSWYAKFRIEYTALPLTGALIILMLNELFPGILPRWLRCGAYALAAAFGGLFLFADTYFMSWAMLGCYAYLAAAIVLVVLFFALRLRRPNAEQLVVLCGALLFFYAAVRDMFYYNNMLLPPFVQADLSQISMLVFVFFQMTAMLRGTVRQVAQARQRELLALGEAEAARTEAERWKAMYATMPPQQTVVRGPLALDTLAQRALVDGQDLLLTPKEFALLLYLAQNMGQHYTAGQLYHAVWGQQPQDDVRTVQVHISNLRKKLKAHGQLATIEMEARRFYTLAVRE